MVDAASALLLRAGVLGPQSLATAQGLKQREGGTLGEALIRLGAIDEKRLVEVFHQGLGVPILAPEALGDIAEAMLQLVPTHMAIEHRVVPVSIDEDGVLTLAMADPSDERAAQEVATHTGRLVLRAAAAPSVVRDALLQHYGVTLPRPEPPLPESVQHLLTPPIGTLLGAVPQPVPAGRRESGRSSARSALPKVERLVKEAALPTTDRTGSVLAALARAVTGPGPAPASSEGESRPPRRSGAGSGEPRGPRRSKPPRGAQSGSPEDPIVLDQPARVSGTPHSTLPGLGGQSELVAPVAQLRAAGTRDEIVKVLLDYASGFAARVGLFVVQRGQLSCVDGRGPDDVVMAMKWISLSLDDPSPFQDVLKSREAYIGTLQDTPAGRAFRSAVGASQGGDVLILPLCVGPRGVGVLYADELKTDLNQLSRELSTLSREAGEALARIIVTKKRSVPTR